MSDSKYYLQSQGTSMGSPFALNYADVFIGLWEDRYIFNNNPLAKNILFFKRYIDDILMGFTGSENELKAFSDDINSTYPTLHFTTEYSQEIKRKFTSWTS